MKKFIIFFCLISSLHFSAQFSSWITRQNLPTNAARTFASSFTIGNFVYVIGGKNASTALNDVWEYDINNDTWLQKNNFPGAARVGATAFSVNGKGYLLCGSGNNGQFFDDVWEYDAPNDSWIQKNTFPGGSREEAACFVIGGSVYFGTGYVEVYGPNNTTWTALDDFWEYTAATDTWVQKANVPGQLRGWAVANAIGNKGYLGLGGNTNQNGSFNDFYEYDPATDSWTAKASYPTALSDAMTFTLNSELYVCGGINFSTGQAFATTRKYTPATNTWTTQPGMSIGATMGAVAINALNRAFVGTGYTSTFSERINWIEFSSTTAATLCIGPVSFSTSAKSATQNCNGSIVVSDISNGCPPFTLSITPATGTVMASSGSVAGFTISSLCAGTYTVIVNDNACCGPGTMVVNVGSATPTGISEENVTHDILVFPNPAKNVLHIASESHLNSLRVFSAEGVEVNIEAKSFGNNYEIKLPELSPGIYILQYRSGNQPKTKKIAVE